jgi:cyclopropane-fatty-acyl-phospholipid synthase
MLFRAILKRIIQTGSLRLIDGAGRIHTYGDGSHLAVRFASALAISTICLP